MAAAVPAAAGGASPAPALALGQDRGTARGRETTVAAGMQLAFNLVAFIRPTEQQLQQWVMFHHTRIGNAPLDFLYTRSISRSRSGSHGGRDHESTRGRVDGEDKDEGGRGRRGSESE